MITQEQFDKLELERGCGYWNLCWEHACPCAITTENKGLQESIWNSMVEENNRITEEYEKEFANEDYNDDYRDEAYIIELEDDLDYDDMEG